TRRTAAGLAGRDRAPGRRDRRRWRGLPGRCARDRPSPGRRGRRPGHEPGRDQRPRAVNAPAVIRGEAWTNDMPKRAYERSEIGGEHRVVLTFGRIKVRGFGPTLGDAMETA